MPSVLLNEIDIAAVYNRQVDTVFRICYSFMKNLQDTEDMVQETFLRLIHSGKTFENERHERAWLIVTASNLCKDALKHWWRKRESLDDQQLSVSVNKVSPVLMALHELPAKYKVAVYMYYYDGYSTGEIAKCLHCSESTVRSRLTRARRKLKEQLGGVSYE